MLVALHTCDPVSRRGAADQAAVRAKTFSTTQAQAALSGIVVDETVDRGAPAWIVRRWSLSRERSSLDQVRALLRRMGVQL